MSFLALTGLVNFLTSFFFGFFSLIKNPGGKLNKIFFFANFSIAIYSFGYFFWQFSDTPEQAGRCFRFLFFGVILISGAFLHFVFVFTEKIKEKKMEIILYHSLNIFFIVICLTDQIYGDLTPRFDQGYWPTPKRVFHIYLVFWSWQLLYGLYYLLVNLKKTSGIKKEQTKYLTLGSIMGFIGGASNWPMWYGIPLPRYPNILISIYIVIIAYAIIRYRFLDIKVMLSRAGILILVYSVVLGIPFWAGYKTDFGLISFLLLFALSTAGPILSRYLINKAENILMYREKYYQQFLRDSTRNVLREKNLEKLLEFIVAILRSSVNIDFTALYLYDKDKNRYVLAASEGLDAEPVQSYDPQESFVKLMFEKKGPVVMEIFSDLYISKNKKSQLLIPAFSDNTILCFIVLGEKIDRSFYNNHDMQAFEIFSNQISLAIDNCMFLESNKINREREFQAEKLAFIGGMAEGVAHRIKNRLNHFSLATAGIKIELDNFTKENSEAVQNSENLAKMIKAIREIGDSLIDNVIRTDQVIQGIINYAQAEETGNFFSKIFFDEIVKGAKDLARIKHEIDKFPLEITIDSSNIITGIKPQLIECLYNLLDNSLDAIDEMIRYRQKEKIEGVFVPSIKIKLAHTETSHLIEVTDNGIGIRDEEKNKIFAPYFTTKTSFKSKAFSGFGLFIVKRMIEENHKGRLWFNSEHLKFSSFFIELPMDAGDIKQSSGNPGK